MMAPVARIFVIDDDADVCAVVRECLVVSGFEVETTTDAEKALDRLREWTPDVIVLDHNMPGISSQQFVERCHDLLETTRLPILLCTADAEARLDRAAVRLEKPFDMGQLLDAVRHCLVGTERGASAAG